ncbi:MAG: hypothetical protein HC779_01070 [Phyllobacteriaceae bacterium]|nr:hypothetical protein [Phyllobacteriaceae bacterium]
MDGAPNEIQVDCGAGFGRFLAGHTNAASAGALSDSGAVSQPIPFGSCTIEKSITVSPSSASLRIVSGGFSYYAGGTLWPTSSARAFSADITSGRIADCLGISASDVTLISQNGADDPFVDDDGFSFSFSTTAATTIGGVNRGLAHSSSNCRELIHLQHRQTLQSRWPMPGPTKTTLPLVPPSRWTVRPHPTLTQTQI